MYPFVSIIVPVYNAELYLIRCLDSLLAQTFEDFEILLIDDGSQDGSALLCDKYAEKDTRIKVYHNQNKGVSSTRQFGLEHAIGEYIIHVDPDDWVEPDMLAELYRKAKSEDADIVICDFFCDYKHKQNYIRQMPSELSSEIVLKELFIHLHGSTWNKLIRRSCCIRYKITFPKDFSFCEDLFFNASLLLHDLRIAYLARAFYHYVQYANPNSIGKKYNINIYNEDIKMLNSFDRMMKDSKSYELCLQRISLTICMRVFVANIFSSKEFSLKLRGILSNAINYPYINISQKLYLTLSSWGGYSLVYKISRIIYQVKQNFI